MPEKENRPRPRRRRRKRSALFAPLSFIVICVAMVFGMSAFFRVSKIEVSGENKYTAAEIIEASGIEEGDNLFFLNRFTAYSRILSKLTYVEDVQVVRSLPNKISIVVTESSDIAYVRVSGEAWIINRGCKLMERAGYTDTEGLIEIIGLTPIAPSQGEVIAPGESEAPKVGYLSAILSEIHSRQLQGEISSIDMSNAANPTFEFLGRFTIKLGKNENTSHKFERMLGVVAQLSQSEAGTIDLSYDKETYFSPN